MIEIVGYLKTHGVAIIGIGSVLLLLVEMITALTPNKSDDLFVGRISKFYSKILGFLKIPNVKLKEGTKLTPDGKHPEKKDS